MKMRILIGVGIAVLIIIIVGTPLPYFIPRLLCAAESSQRVNVDGCSRLDAWRVIWSEN